MPGKPSHALRRSCQLAAWCLGRHIKLQACFLCRVNKSSAAFEKSDQNFEKEFSSPRNCSSSFFVHGGYISWIACSLSRWSVTWCSETRCPNNLTACTQKWDSAQFTLILCCWIWSRTICRCCMCSMEKLKMRMSSIYATTNDRSLKHALIPHWHVAGMDQKASWGTPGGLCLQWKQLLIHPWDPWQIAHSIW